MKEQMSTCNARSHCLQQLQQLWPHQQQLLPSTPLLCSILLELTRMGSPCLIQVQLIFMLHSRTSQVYQHNHHLWANKDDLIWLVQAPYPPYMNYVYPPFNSIPSMSSHAFPFDSFRGQYQNPASRLQLLAPKPPPGAHVKSTGASQAQPPAFLEMVKEIREQLFEMGGLSASDEPLAEGSIYSKWWKAIINTWKSVSLLVDFMFKENMSKKIQKTCYIQAMLCNLFPVLLPFSSGSG